jgi:hypothetical protein
LRHEGEELAGGRQPGEIAERDSGVADLDADAFDLVVGQLEEFVEQAQLASQLEG